MDYFAGGTVNPATRFAVTSSSYSVTAGTSVTVSAQLEDNSSNPVSMSGLTVNWSVTGGSASPTSSATNGSGIATTTFTTTTSTGNFTVSASATRIPTGVYEGNSPVIHGVPGAAVAANSTILAVPTLIDADGISTAAITVRAIDANGNGLTAGGATVLLSTTTGTLGSVTDVGDGSYTATLTSSTIAGTALITGTLGGTTIGGSATVEFQLAGTVNPAVYAPRPVRSGQREVRAGVRST